MVTNPTMTSQEYHEMRQWHRDYARRKKRLRKRKMVEDALYVTVSVIFGIILVKLIFFSNDIVISENPMVARANVNDEKISVSENIKDDGFIEVPYSDEDIEYLAKTVYGEALITHSDTEMAGVAWCILNRVDDNRYPDTIAGVVTQPMQFHGFNDENPVTDDLKNLCIDVYMRWFNEKNGCENVGRVLPKDYLFFVGDGSHNVFSTEYHGGSKWSWTCETPYES